MARLTPTMLAALLFAALLHPAAPPAPDSTERATRPTVATLQHAEVTAEGIDRPRLLDAIQLRVPHVSWVAFGASPRPAEPDALAAVVSVRIAPAQPHRAALTIIVSDGRAFDRSIDLTDIEPAEQPRLVANNVANIVAGIEAGTIVPDRDAVPLPEAPTACPECPAVPEPPPCPKLGLGTATESPPRSHAIGVTAGLPLLVGIAAPSDADRFAAVGLEVGVSARLRGGATFVVGYRLAGRRSVGEVSALRNRVAVGAGYSLRRGAFELEATLLGTVEPWLVRLAGERATFGDIDREQVLIGLSARVAPGIRWPVPKRPISVVLTPFVELAASASPGDDFSIPRIVLPGEEASRIRVGGIEVVTGLATRVWFDLGRDGSS